MNKFKIGDVCIGQNFIYDTHLNGMECTVIQSLDRRPVWHTTFGGDTLVLLCYEVEWANGCIWYIMEPNLKLKQPPTKESGLQTILEMFKSDKFPLVINEKESESV